MQYKNNKPSEESLLEAEFVRTYSKRAGLFPTPKYVFDQEL
jgi:hypothetical protein